MPRLSLSCHHQCHHQRTDRTASILLAAALTAAGCSAADTTYRATAATAPSTDIFLATLTATDGGVDVTDIVNITDRDGYDNQPHFLPGGAALLYTSARDTLQTDIYRYDIASASVTQLTHTMDASEFSPTIMPGGEGFSTIHEDANDQQLWRFDMAGTSLGGLLDDLQPVGYHVWGGTTTIVAFVLGDSVTPPTLHMADVMTGETSLVTENPGRSLHRTSEGAVSFVHKISDDEWLIKTVDTATGRVATLTPTLPGQEDYAWMPDGSIVMGQGSALYRWTQADGWLTMADLGPHGVSGISRIAIPDAGNRIAVVGNRTP